LKSILAAFKTLQTLATPIPSRGPLVSWDVTAIHTPRPAIFPVIINQFDAFTLLKIF
jgi:hypothetical protein